MDNSLLTKFIAVVVVLIAFVDGILIGQHFQEKSAPVQAADVLILEEIQDQFPDRLGDSSL